jgi:hypothetical protein
MLRNCSRQQAALAAGVFGTVQLLRRADKRRTAARRYPSHRKGIRTDIKPKGHGIARGQTYIITTTRETVPPEHTHYPVWAFAKEGAGADGGRRWCGDRKTGEQKKKGLPPSGGGSGEKDMRESPISQVLYFAHSATDG